MLVRSAWSVLLLVSAFSSAEQFTVEGGADASAVTVEKLMPLVGVPAFQANTPGSGNPSTSATERAPDISRDHKQGAPALIPRRSAR